MSAEPMLPSQVEEDERYRSFTVRVPMSLYVRMSNLAQAEGLFLNKKANQLLLLGLGEHIKLDDVLMRLIKTNIPEEPTP